MTVTKIIDMERKKKPLERKLDYEYLNIIDKYIPRFEEFKSNTIEEPFSNHHKVKRLPLYFTDPIGLDRKIDICRGSYGVMGGAFNYIASFAINAFMSEKHVYDNTLYLKSLQAMPCHNGINTFINILGDEENELQQVISSFDIDINETILNIYDIYVKTQERLRFIIENNEYIDNYIHEISRISIWYYLFESFTKSFCLIEPFINLLSINKNITYKDNILYYDNEAHEYTKIVVMLKEMYINFKKDFIKNTKIMNKKSSVIFFPNFGPASQLLDGAEGDIIIDYVLIDFKTYSTNEYSLDTIRQLFSYYILELISNNGIYNNTRISCNENMNFDSIAVYNPRHGTFDFVNMRKYFESCGKSFNCDMCGKKCRHDDLSSYIIKEIVEYCIKRMKELSKAKGYLDDNGRERKEKLWRDWFIERIEMYKILNDFFIS